MNPTEDQKQVMPPVEKEMDVEKKDETEKKMVQQIDAGESESEPCSSPAAAEMERIIDERRNEKDSDRDSIDDMCAEVRIEKKKDSEAPKERKIPGYMMPTASSNRRTSMIREDNRRKSLCAMRPNYTPTVIEPEHLKVSSFMRPTASYTSRYSTIPSSTPVRSQQIRQVDSSNLPRYMRDTVAYRRSIAPEIEKTPVSPNRIREVDRAHLPVCGEGGEQAGRGIQPDQAGEQE